MPSPGPAPEVRRRACARATSGSQPMPTRTAVRVAAAGRCPGTASRAASSSSTCWPSVCPRSRGGKRRPSSATSMVVPRRGRAGRPRRTGRRAGRAVVAGAPTRAPIATIAISAGLPARRASASRTRPAVERVDDQVGVVAAEPERADRRAPRGPATARPRAAAAAASVASASIGSSACSVAGRMPVSHRRRAP